VHDGVHLLLRQVDVRAAFVGDQEAVAIAVAGKRAFDLAEQAGTVFRRGYCVLKVFDDRISVLPEF